MIFVSKVVGMITRQTLARYRARICFGHVDFVELPLGGHGVQHYEEYFPIGQLWCAAIWTFLSLDIQL